MYILYIYVHIHMYLYNTVHMYSACVLHIGRCACFMNCTYDFLIFQDYIIGELRNPHQWFVHCILPHNPHKLPHALAGGDVDRSSVYGRLDVPLVSAQLKRSDIVKAARLYKQGTLLHTVHTGGPLDTNP